jgi:hypothetical protein
MESLEVEVDVSENFINRVHPEQEAAVILNAYPDWRIPAKVAAIIPTADRAKATVKVRVGFAARDARILPEMGVRVAFLGSGTTAAAAGQAPVAVPAAAVQAAGENGVVYVVNGDVVERRTVRLGAASAESRVVIGGLAAGARLAVGDLSALADGARVRIE